MAESLSIGGMPAPHGFFTRRGGVSTGPFASLNCSLSSPDDRDAVLENRARAARAVGAEPEYLLGLRQVHGAHVVSVAEPWAIGGGQAGDAMVTDRAGIALGIVTADCAPVLFAGADGRVVGAAHAGWRGAVLGVLEATLQAMAALGAPAPTVTAAIGPCIAQASYEVGPDLREAVLARSAADAAFFAPGARPGRWQFDLPGYCAARLRAAGAGAVLLTGRDTLAESGDFFSHRRRTLAQAAGGPAEPIGHQISVIRPGL
jgi:hypothetical protein